jgi:hypothetical protein
MYLANPTSSPAVHDAMRDGTIGFIGTPAQGNKRPEGLTWCADNGCFSDKWDEAKWWQYLVDNAGGVATCLFAVAPDVVGDAWRSHMRSYPWLAKIKALGYRVAYVFQNGADRHPIPWHDFDVAFLGGSPECVPCNYVFREKRKPKRDEPCPRCNRLLTEWKLGAVARSLAAEAKSRGKWVHVGRVNSARRWRYCATPIEHGGLGADSCDGTYLTFGPDTNLPKLLAWTRNNDQGALWEVGA